LAFAARPATVEPSLSSAQQTFRQANGLEHPVQQAAEFLGLFWRPNRPLPNMLFKGTPTRCAACLPLTPALGFTIEIMEIAKLILEFLKVLTWPLVTLVIVWQFRPHLERILKQFGDRLKTAETLKVGVMGQEVQLSGTARELVKERDLLVQTGKLDESTQQALAIDAATRELNNPMADLVGMILLAASEAMPLEEITRRLIKTMSPNEAPNQQTPFMVVMMSKEIEKMLMSLQSLAYIQCHDDVYALSQSGREFFQRVQERYGLFMAKFQALGQLRQGERSGG